MPVMHPDDFIELMDELAANVKEQIYAWLRARLELETAQANYEYAEKRLRLARDRFLLEVPQDDAGYVTYEDWLEHRPPDAEHPEPLDQDDLDSIQFVGETMRFASRASLGHLGKEGGVTTEELVDYMVTHGFRFSTEAPAREVHGALLKQAWAKRDSKTGTWRWQEVRRS